MDGISPCTGRVDDVDDAEMADCAEVDGTDSGDCKSWRLRKANKVKNI